MEPKPGMPPHACATEKVGCASFAGGSRCTLPNQYVPAVVSRRYNGDGSGASNEFRSPLVHTDARWRGFGGRGVVRPEAIRSAVCSSKLPLIPRFLPVMPAL